MLKKLLLVGLLLFLAGCSRSPVKIGAILGLTGVSSEAVMEIKNGLELAISEVNKRGGINGHSVKLLIRDSKSETDEGIKQFLDLAEKEEPLAMITTLSLNSVTIAPYAEDLKIPMFCLLTGSPEPTAGREWVYQFNPTSNEETENIISIMNKLSIKNTVLFYSEEEWGESLRRSMIERIQSRNLPISVKEFSYKLGHEDFSEAVAMALEADSVCILGFASYYKKILHEFRANNYTGELFSVLSITHYSIASLEESYGVYTSAPLLYNPDYNFAVTLSEKYSKIYGERISHYAASAYDLVMAVSTRLEDVEISRPMLKQRFDEGFIFTGAMGVINIKPNQHLFAYPLYPARILEGGIQFID